MKKQLNIQKMQRRMREMENFRFVETYSLFPMQVMDDPSPEAVHIDALEILGNEKAQEGERYQGKNRYLWLGKKVEVPPVKQGFRPAGRFDFGKTGLGHNSGFESLLYVNGSPYQGVDSNHKEVMLEKFASEKIELTFLLWSGLDGEGNPPAQDMKLRQAEIGYLHEATDELYYLYKAAVKTLDMMKEENPAWEDIYSAMQVSLQELDWDVDSFYESVPAALEKLKEWLSRTEYFSNIMIHCSGHSHIDLAWLWQLKHTREKAIRSFSTVLRLMDEFEEYKFFQSQPQLYQYVKQDDPVLYSKIQERVKEGRWEADGGMWVEADCNIASGEALARQFLYGQRFLMKEFGKRSTCLWLPDVFGYSWALPQIMKQSGIESFITTKISWNQFNTMPDDLFNWRGMDGSEVLTYFINTPDPGHPPDSRYGTYNGLLNPTTVLGSWNKFKNKDVSRDVLIAYGYGDGGGGPTRNMLQMRRAMDQIPGLPNVECSSVNNFLEKTWEQFKEAGSSVNTWDGELYLEYHRGTYTSQAATKKWNRKLENMLVETEMLQSLAAIQGGENDPQALKEPWEIVLRNQFHDIIPGSSIREVYEDSEEEYQQALEIAQKVQTKTKDTLIDSSKEHITLFSSASVAAKQLVLLPGTEKFSLNGKELDSQPTGKNSWVEVSSVPVGFTVIESGGKKEVEKPSAFQCKEKQGKLSTPFYQIEWDKEGKLTRVYDKQFDKEVLRPDGDGGGLSVYEDKPLNYENWDIDLYYTEKKESPTLLSATLVEDGPLRCTIRFIYRYRKSSILMDMVAYSNNRRVDFETKVDWQESRRLLRVSFDTNLRTTKASYDIQYGHVERPNHRNTSWDIARFEAVGHKWADLSEANYGVSLLNDCKYGYSALGSVLGLSLLKSGKYPDPEADMGEHSFTFSLLPHEGNVVMGDTIKQGILLNLPLLIFQGKVKGVSSLLQLEGEGVLIDTIKLAEEGNGIIVRLHECNGGSRSVNITASLPIKKITPCNLLEEDSGESFAKQSLKCDFSPFEIKSFRLEY